jgi:hypothetical protein
LPVKAETFSSGLQCKTIWKLTSLDTFFDLLRSSCLSTKLWYTICILGYLCASLNILSDMSKPNLKIIGSRKTYRRLLMSLRTVRESIITDMECRRTTARLALKIHLSRWTKIARFLDNHYTMIRRNTRMRCCN